MCDAASKQEQRFVIKFHYRSGKNAQETFDIMKQTYGNQCLGRSTIFRWHSSFKKGRESAKLIPHGGRPKTAATEVNINTVWAMVQEDRSITVERIADIMNISVGSAHHILKDELKLNRVCARWVPHFLTTEQMKKRVEKCSEWKKMLRNDPNFLDRVITADETWAYYWDPKTKIESSTWKHVDSPRATKVRQSKSAGKVMIITFFDCRGLVYQHEVPSKTTVNANYYVEVLKQLRRHILKKRPEIADNWILHHDNATPHTARVVLDCLDKFNIPVMPHPPYSPDLAPCDFSLFSELKKRL